MAIRVNCSHCGQWLAAPDHLAGRTGRCPHCQGEIYVAESPTDPRIAVTPPPPPKPPREDEVAPRGALLKTAAALFGALVLGALLCAVFVAGMMVSRLSRDSSAASTETGTQTTQGEPSAIEANASSQPPTPTAQDAATTVANDLASQVHDILRRNCYACHGEGGAAEGGFNFVLRRDKLIEVGHVVAGQPADSPLLERIKDGEMP